MKFVAPLAILCSLSAPISAGRYVRGLKGGEDKDGAWYYGRGRAAKLWRYYGYTCADDVVTEYWLARQARRVRRSEDMDLRAFGRQG